MRVPYENPSREGTPWAGASDAEFGSWGWQVKHRLDSLEDAERLFRLAPEEREGILRTRGLFRFGVTPYYALLARKDDPACPIRRQIIPRVEETVVRPGELRDPLGEEPREVVPNLVHRYPDRVLLLATDRCPVYCRFCTRRRIVGRTEQPAPRELLREAFAYVRAHDEIREVIVSGGDALMLSDANLDFILREIRAARHVDIIRIASRMPVTCPMRIGPRLVETLRRHEPVYVLTHFNHARECTEWARDACARFVDGGVPVHNQSVLLRGVNDDVEAIRELNRLLVFFRVTPYYLHQCDMAEGIEHFRTPLAVGLAIIDGLRGHTSGLAVPHLCVDVPGGLGKVTLQPDWVLRREGRSTVFRTYTGESAAYLDPEIEARCSTAAPNTSSVDSLTGEPYGPQARGAEHSLCSGNLKLEAVRE